MALTFDEIQPGVLCLSGQILTELYGDENVRHSLEYFDARGDISKNDIPLFFMPWCRGIWLPHNCVKITTGLRTRVSAVSDAVPPYIGYPPSTGVLQRMQRIPPVDP